MWKQINWEGTEYWTRYVPYDKNVHHTFHSNHEQTKTREEMIQRMNDKRMGWQQFGIGHIRQIFYVLKGIMQGMYHIPHYKNLVSYHSSDYEMKKTKKKLYFNPGHPLNNHFVIHYTGEQHMTLSPCGDDIKCPKMPSYFRQQCFLAIETSYLHPKLQGSIYSGVIVAIYPKKSTQDEAKQMVHACLMQLEEDKWKQVWFEDTNNNCHVIVDVKYLAHADWPFFNDVMANSASCLSRYRFPGLVKFTNNNHLPQHMAWPQDFTWQNYNKYVDKNKLLEILAAKKNSVNDNDGNSNDNNNNSNANDDNSNENNNNSNENDDTLMAWGTTPMKIAKIMYQMIEDYVDIQENQLNRKYKDFEQYINDIKTVARDGFHHGQIGPVFEIIWNGFEVEKYHAMWSELARIITDVLKIQVKILQDPLDVILDNVKTVYGEGMLYDQFKTNASIIQKANNRSPKLNFSLPGRKLVQTHKMLNLYLIELDKHIHAKHGKNRNTLYITSEMHRALNHNDNNDNNNERIDLVSENDNDSDEDSDNMNDEDSENDQKMSEIDEMQTPQDGHNNTNNNNSNENNRKSNENNGQSDENNINNDPNIGKSWDNPIVIGHCRDFTHTIISEFAQSPKEQIDVNNKNDLKYLKCLYNICKPWRFSFIIKKLFSKVLVPYIAPADRIKGHRMMRRAIWYGQTSFWTTSALALEHHYPYQSRIAFELIHVHQQNFERLENGRMGAGSQFTEKQGQLIKNRCDIYSSSRDNFAERVNGSIILCNDYKLMTGRVDLFKILKHNDKEPKLWDENKTQFDIQKQFDQCSETMKYFIRNFENVTQKRTRTREFELLRTLRMSAKMEKFFRKDIDDPYNKIHYTNKDLDESDSDNNENDQNSNENEPNDNENDNSNNQKTQEIIEIESDNSNENNNNHNDNNLQASQRSETLNTPLSWQNFN